MKCSTDAAAAYYLGRRRGFCKLSTQRRHVVKRIACAAVTQPDSSQAWRRLAARQRRAEQTAQRWHQLASRRQQRAGPCAHLAKRMDHIHLNTHSRWSALMLWQKRLAAGGHAWCVDSRPRVTREYDRRAFPLLNAVGPLPHSHGRCCNLKTTANNSCMGLRSVCNAKLAAAREADSRTRLSRRACKSLHTTIHQQHEWEPARLNSRLCNLHERRVQNMVGFVALRDLYSLR